MKKKLPYFFVIISIFILLLTVTVKDLNVTFAATVDNLTLKENAKVAYDTTSITSDVSSFNRYSIRYKSSTYIKGVITYKVNGVIENERFFLEPTEDYKVFSSFINGYIDNYSSTKKDIVSLVKRIIEMYKVRMKNNTFLAEETKIEAIKKLTLKQ